MLQSPNPIGILGLVLDSQDEQSRGVESNRFGIAGWTAQDGLITSVSTFSTNADWFTTAIPGPTGNLLVCLVVSVGISVGNFPLPIQAGISIDGGTTVVGAAFVPGSVVSPYTYTLFGYVPAPGLAQGVEHTLQFEVASDGTNVYSFDFPAMAVWPL